MSVRFIGRFLECAAALIFALGVAYAQCTNSGNVYTCTSSGSTGTPIISINDTSDNTVQNGTYPVTITVPNTVTGTVSSVVVVLNGVTASDAGFNYGLGSLGLLLVHAGANLEIMSSPGDGGEGFSSATFYISDTLVSGLGTINAFGYMPIDSPVSCGTAAPFVPPGEGGTYAGISDYRPSSYEFGIAKGSYSSPAPSSINYSGPCYPSTINTLGAAFGGTAADGAWSLYAVGFGYADVQIANWSVIITTANATSTTTTLTSTVNPSFTTSPSNTTTLTATVSGGATGGTVAFADGATTLCAAVALASGSATCNAIFTTQGFHALTATYSGTANFGTSTGTLNQFAELHTTSGGTNIFCNTGGISLGTSNVSGTDTSPYPSVVNVTGISNSVSTVQLVLTTVSTNNLLDLSMLLVSPDGNHSLDFFDYIGGAVSTTSTAVTMADSPTCSSLGPNGSGGLASPACYQPTSYRYPGFDVPPSFLDPPQPAPQVPGTFSLATPGGGVSAKAFLEAFNGATANGAWSLYVYDHGNSNTSSIGGGWCLNITPGVGLSTTTTVSGSPNAAAPSGAATGSPVTITATVKQGTNLVNKGSVSFTLNGAAIAGGTNVSVGTSGPTQGQASFVTSALPEGDNLILATYTDSTNTYSESFGTYTQRVDTTTTVTVNGITVTYCNTGQVKVPGPNNATDAGAGSPNPSNVTVASLFGTLNTLTVTLNGYSEGQPDLLTSLLVGPSSNLDFFSLAGGATGVGPFNLTFSDAATTLVPETNGSLVAGTYKPSSYTTGTDTYTSSTSGFYTLPGTFNYAATKGSATFASIFSGNPNGNWDLYFNQTGNNRGGGLATGWCLNFVENPPALTMTKVHSGNFVQGQQGAQFTLTVDNTGLGTAGGPIPVTVVDILPSGLTPAATPGTGTGWTCGAVSQTVTCTNSTVVPSSSSFPRLTLNVNVANNAGASLSNTASVNGSGNATAVNSNRDTVTIQSAPVLVISKSPSGNFTQGSTAIWDIVVSNTATANSTTSGLVTVVDTLPSGYSFFSYTGSPTWTCGAVGVTVTCTSTAAVSGGSSYTTIGLTVNVPATSPTSVTNNASAYGGGDLTHTSLGTAATTFSTVTVIQVPASIGLTTGNSQSVAINTAFPINLSATILDAASVAISGATVTFTAPGTGASGTFAGATNVKTATTNGSGVATATVYTANSTAGGPYNIGVAAGTVTNNYSETNRPGPATQMSANAGTTPQSATINTAFANALAVTVKDAGSNPIAGVNVTFTAPGAGASGTFSNSTATIIVVTNASGVAAAPFTANGTAGVGYTVTAAASGLTTVNFSLTNLAGAPSSMTANAGTTPQSATINTAFANTLAVTVKDAGSNPISGVNVTFTAPGAGASGKFSNSTVTITVTTNSSGIASAPFTANSMAGAGYTVTASAAGLTSVNFTLTNLAGAAASITAVAGSTPQSATVNTAFANALAVTVKDAGSNPISGVTVTFTAPGAGASGTFSNSTVTITVTTNSSGIASAPFTANSMAGAGYTVTASAAGLTSVNFTLTNLAGAAASITAVAGSTPQSATVSTAFANPLAVTIKDAFNNPISGANVVFAAPGSGASGAFSNSSSTITISTNASGVSSAGIFTANATAGGPYSVTATAGSLQTSFSLTNNSVVVSGPTVVSYKVLFGASSYNVIGTTRNRLPWQISGIQVVFSSPIASGDVNSLSGTGISTTGFSGLGTTTLTWTITPVSIGNFPTTLAGSGPDALKDAGGNPLTGGAGFNQNLKILWGDFNDDGIVNASDLTLVNNARSQPYNILADMNGDGVVNTADVTIVRAHNGQSLP